MAAVDASIGIKTAVNFEMNGVVKKNKLGTYSPPLAVFIDKAFLSTLDRRHLSNGAAEVSWLADMLCTYNRPVDGTGLCRVLYAKERSLRLALASHVSHGACLGQRCG